MVLTDLLARLRTYIQVADASYILAIISLKNAINSDLTEIKQ